MAAGTSSSYSSYSSPSSTISFILGILGSVYKETAVAETTESSAFALNIASESNFISDKAQTSNAPNSNYAIPSADDVVTDSNKLNNKVKDKDTDTDKDNNEDNNIMIHHHPIRIKITKYSGSEE